MTFVTTERQDEFRRDLTLRQLERAAELAERDDDYSRRWAPIHIRMAVAVLNSAWTPKP